MPGHYAGAIANLPFVAPAGSVKIIGDINAPSEYVLGNSGAGTCLQVSAGAIVELSGVQISNPGSSGLWVTTYGMLYYHHMDFAACLGNHAFSTDHGFLSPGGSYTISGGAAAHWETDLLGGLWAFNVSITLMNNPNFSVAFAYATAGGLIETGDCTFSGAARGRHYFRRRRQSYLGTAKRDIFPRRHRRLLPTRGAAIPL